jgi:putative glutamine amidotransferase
MKVKAPRIGITLDYVDPAQEKGGEWYSKHPWYALRYRYCEAVALAGGLPLALSYYMELIEDYAENLDGLVITGGGFDVDPGLYGIQERHPTVNIKPKRTEFEMAMARQMLKANKPVLGICGGMQVLNVLHGGTLYQDIPSEASSEINHKQTHDRFLPQHTVNIKPATLLANLANNSLTVSVNSVHHQAVRSVAPGFEINAAAPDGIIEGIESSQYKFCLGLQWHPEFHVSEADEGIFHGLIHACRS